MVQDLTSTAGASAYGHSAFRERRQHKRYSVALKLRFTARGLSSVGMSFSGKGTVVDMSSTGLQLDSDTSLNAGDVISTSVEWPWSSPGRALSLLLHGHVVWCVAPRAGIAFSRYSFSEAGRGSIRGASAPAPHHGTSEVSSGGPLRSILVVEKAEIYLLVATMMPRRPIQRLDAAQAVEVLTGNPRSVGLLITDTIEEFARLDVSVPVIYIPPAGASPRPPERAATSPMIVLPRPFVYSDLRSAVRQLLGGRGGKIAY